MGRRQNRRKLSRDIITGLLIVVAFGSIGGMIHGFGPQLLPNALATLKTISFIPTIFTWSLFTPTLPPATAITSMPTLPPATSLAPFFYFTLSLLPPFRTVMQGGTATFHIFITYSDPMYYGTSIQTYLTGGFPGMEWNILPGGALIIATSPVTPPGVYPFTITGYAKGVTNQVSGVLTVTPIPTTATTAFGFSLTVSPSTQNVQAGNTASYTVTVSPTIGQGPVSLSVQGLPQGVTGTFSTQSGTPPFTSTLNLQTSNSAPGGTYTLTVIGTGGPNQSSSATAMLTLSQMQSVAVSLAAQASSQVITVSGVVSPAIPGATLQVTYTAPDGSQTTHNVAVNGDGTYQDSFSAGTSGTWTVVASWQGNSNYSPASSTPVTLTIQGSVLDSLTNPTALVAIGLAVVVVALAIALLRRRTSTQTQAQPSTSTGPTVYCRGCGAKNAATDGFCSKCGKKLG